MYKLYARPGAGNVAVEALLAELGMECEIITLERDAQHQLPESFAAINPMKQVPALVLPSGEIMTESAAIMIHLADLHPEKGLAPGITAAARSSYLRWMVFMATALYNTDLLFFYPHRYSTDETHAEAIKARAGQDMMKQFGILADQVGQNRYLIGNSFSAADIYAAMLFNWAPDITALAAQHPNLKALHDAVAKRPAITPVWKRNDMG